MKNVGCDACRHADLALERLAVEACQHGHAEAEGSRDPEVAGGFDRRFGGCARHRQAPARVDVEHEDTETRRLAHRGGDGIRDVVEFEVEKDAKAPFAGSLDRSGTGRREELRADLAPREDALEAAEQRLRLVQARHVECHQHPVGGARRGQRGIPAGSARGARP